MCTTSLEYFDSKLSKQKILEYACKPFDLKNGPLCRFALIKNGKKRYKFIVVLHHMIIDGSSGNFFADNLSKYYNDTPYKANISIEQQLHLMNILAVKLYQQIKADEIESKVFWNQYLFDVEPINLNFLRYTTNVLTAFSTQKIPKVGVIKFIFGNKIISKLHKLKQKYKITPYWYSQCIFALLIYKYTSQSKFCISYPLAIKEGMDFIYGAHVNTTLMPYDFSKTSSIEDLFEQILQFSKISKRNDIKFTYTPIYNINSSRKIYNCIFAQTNLKEDKGFNFTGIKSIVRDEINIDLPTLLVFEQETFAQNINYKIKYNNDLINVSLLKKFLTYYKNIFKEILNELIKLEESHNIKYIGKYNIIST